MKNCFGRIFKRSGDVKHNGVANEKPQSKDGQGSLSSSSSMETSRGDGISVPKSDENIPHVTSISVPKSHENIPHITIHPAKHAATKWYQKGVSTADELFHGAAPEKHPESQKILQGTFQGFDFDQNTICASTNGLVRSAIYAYGRHYHLTLRPDDVWFAILTQVGFYINKHAEELRNHFVEHEGKKKLVVERYGTIETVDIGEMSVEMSNLIQANVKDPDLQKWIMPNFSTTKEEDIVVASVLMMGAMQKYFAYFYACCCGIPSVTLLGTREDWLEMFCRLKKLKELGEEPTEFYAVLKPILSFFVRSFDEPDSPQVIDFWQKIAEEDGGSGNTYLSGWITAFCFWDADGNRMMRNLNQTEDISMIQVDDTLNFDLDIALKGRIDTDVVPAGFAVVPATVNDNGEEYKTKLIAGSIGIQVTSSGQKLDEGPIYSHQQGQQRKPTGIPGLDSLQPVTGWWMYKLKPELQE
ncbi:hypothetical protein EV356DRAFT_499772 [Viridothelium virens]|uniref:DUF4419 domain-containing protein n=1 Tax=Viridothelium virens TaxID=1048519 RepID=A0A6A6HNC1_VIRVR|nr:hypothetical protein EV356DRAFT_499772 [Viridothelium virens]